MFALGGKKGLSLVWLTIDKFYTFDLTEMPKN